MSLTFKAIAVALLLAALVFGWSELTSHYDRQGYDRAKAEDKAEADLQQERNRELQRQAERNYVVQAGIRDRFIVHTVKEIEHAAAPLASCAVSPDLVRMLNSTASCALGDSAACGSPDGAVRRP